MATNGNIIHPPIDGDNDQIEVPAENLHPYCVRCTQYMYEEERERAMNPDGFNTTMFRLACWSKDLNDILLHVDQDVIPGQGNTGFKQYMYQLNESLFNYFRTYR